ncbi:uncharacterized protein METZ01_LOCUS424994 [marine metagenome]|uniref:Uncharacterized protein n=1 Tax=marine metagenome TaxID=408172 RepID=A0A382XMS6_9ZZZZ
MNHRGITKDELMEEIVDIFAHNYLGSSHNNDPQLSFRHYTFSATPEIIREYAKRMMSMYREYDLCGAEIFRLIESRCSTTVIKKLENVPFNAKVVSTKGDS